MADSSDNPSEHSPQPADGSDPAEQPESSQTPEQTVEQSLDAAQKAAESISHETGDTPADATGAASLDLPNFQKHEQSRDPAAALGMLNDIDLHVQVELGRTRMYIDDVLKLNENSIVELDKAAGDPVDIYVNNRHVARGEVLVLSDNFCVRVSEIIKQGEDEEERANYGGNGAVGTS